MADVKTLASDALTTGDGILRLAPTWVPRSFLQPSRRLKLHPADYNPLGMHRGGIDERWFGSTTVAANDNRNEDEGVTFENTGKEPLVGLRYFGPNAQPDAPAIGAYKK